MASDLSSLVFKLLMLSSCMLAGGQNCLISGYHFRDNTVTLSAESANESTPAVRVTWSTTTQPGCVASVRIVFRRSTLGSVVTSYTTTNTSGIQVIQSPLQCATEYYVRVFVTGVERVSGIQLRSMQKRVVVGDVPGPFIVRAEATADNASIRVSWEWSCQGVPMYINSVRVHYQPEGGSLMMYTVDNTTATSATLLNLQCNTKYTIWVHAEGGQFNGTSVLRMVSLPARAPPTPTNVTAWLMNASSVRVAWQWTSSGPAPNCFNTTRVTYRPEGGGESFLQLSDPAANEATLTDLQNNRCYTITVVATAGEHRKEGVTLQGAIWKSACVQCMFICTGTTSMCPEVSGLFTDACVSTDPSPSTEPSPDTPPISPEVSSQCMSTSAVAGVAVTAVLVLLVVAVVQSAVIWYLNRSIDKIKSQTQRATAACDH